jgi:hypothetical protein
MPACINCNSEVSTPFCPTCGQKNPVKKITIANMWSDFLSRVYGFDGMFPRTLRDLTLRPGLAARKYIEGNRVQYYGPVGYFFLMITVCLLLMSILHVDFFDFIKGMQQSLNTQNANVKLQENFKRLISDNMKTFAFMAIPFQGLAAHYFLFRKSGYNLLENMVLPFYTGGHMYWLTMLSIIPYKIVGDNYQLLTSLLGVLFIGFSYTTMMDNYQSKVKCFFKGIGVFIVGQLLFIVAFVVSMILTIGVWRVFDKQAVKEFFGA